MILYYIRHGHPIYDPDSLTPLGERQAEALAKRLALYGVDRIYSSTSERAIQTAKPTCELLRKDMELLDFANENYPWESLTCETGWLFENHNFVYLMNSKEMRDLGDRWFDHPTLKKYNFEKEINRAYDAIDELFASFGYEHIRYSGKYAVKRSNKERIALFAHQGFGLEFLSCLLDIPYPMMSTHFDICHTGMTVIEFSEFEGYTVPKILTLSSDSHLYREGLPTKYNDHLYF